MTSPQPGAQVADPGRDVLRPVPDHARQHDRQRRAALDPARPRRVALDARVDDQRLRPLLRRADHARRQAGRPLRPQAPVPGRASASSPRCRSPAPWRRASSGWWHSAPAQGVGGRPDEPAHPVDHRRRLPPPRAGHRHRHLGRHLGASPWRSARCSAACWWSTSTGRPSSGSTCRWGSWAPLVTIWAVAESRDPTSLTLDLPGVALITGGLFLLVWGLIETNDHGWASAYTIAFLGRGRRDPRWPSSPGRPARANPMVPARVLQAAPLQRARGAGGVRRPGAVRGRLLHHPLLPEREGLVAREVRRSPRCR